MLITNIQRFSLHDGPGIRTTVFMKGCALRCPWCSNPENQDYYAECYEKDGVKGTYGRDYSVDEVYTEVMKDKSFYYDGGGATFSGGEALLFADELLPLLQKLKEAGISTAVETSLFVPTEKLKEVIPFIDYFYVDMKIMEAERCKDVTNGDLSLYITNMDLLSANKKFILRIPVIGGYTDDESNRRRIIESIVKYRDAIIKIELLREHNLGLAKYQSLALESPEYKGVSNEVMEKYKAEIETKVDIPVEICRI